MPWSAEAQDLLEEIAEARLPQPLVAERKQRRDHRAAEQAERAKAERARVRAHKDALVAIRAASAPAQRAAIVEAYRVEHGYGGCPELLACVNELDAEQTPGGDNSVGEPAAAAP